MKMATGSDTASRDLLAVLFTMIMMETKWGSARTVPLAASSTSIRTETKWVLAKMGYLEAIFIMIITVTE